MPRKAKLYDEIPSENQGGDCFEASGRYMMDNAMYGGNSDLLLVHGEVTGQGPIRGVKYGHAWIEDGNTIHDVSRGRDIQMPKDLYYALGNINESSVFKYDMEHMRQKILDSGHWGPWDLKTKY